MSALSARADIGISLTANDRFCHFGPETGLSGHDPLAAVDLPASENAQNLASKNFRRELRPGARGQRRINSLSADNTQTNPIVVRPR